MSCFLVWRGGGAGGPGALYTVINYSGKICNMNCMVQYRTVYLLRLLDFESVHCRVPCCVCIEVVMF